MALPVSPPPPPPAWSPAVAADNTGQRELLAAPNSAHSVKPTNGAEHERRRQQHHHQKHQQHQRRNSPWKPKRTTEEPRRTRTRGGSSATVDATTTTTTTTPGRFTVGNINNGIIYLRPVVRPGNQRNRPWQDPFLFPPATPPPDDETPAAQPPNNKPTSNVWRESFSSSPRTPTGLAPPQLRTPAGVIGLEEGGFPEETPPKLASRSHSFSTLDERPHIRDPEPDTFRVVIERPSLRRPKTADINNLPVLQVPIPHYRLGSPRFSAQGTAILRSSVYTKASGAEDMRNSLLFSPSPRDSGKKPAPSPGGAAPPAPETLHRLSGAYTPSFTRRSLIDMPIPPASGPSSARISKHPIGPDIYDAIASNPDDPSQIRYSPSGEIVAATPSRLIAHITSPNVLDYEILSDFFLTFRSFLSCHDLAAYLVARMRWAVSRADDFGRVVRVRSFVALRHWILNYFVDDFVPDATLRAYFCDVVNELYDELRAREDGGGGDIKIVGELKKCWRRTCAQYWGGGEAQFSPDSKIEPGPDPDAAVADSWEEPGSAQEQAASTSHPPLSRGMVGSISSAYILGGRETDWSKSSYHHQVKNSTNTAAFSSYPDNPATLSPQSERSMQVFSCSIPVRNIRVDAGGELPLFPHPVPMTGSTHCSSHSRPSRSPQTRHKRSGSFSDALRDHHAPSPLPKTSDGVIHTSPPPAPAPAPHFPGSLIRGALFQPESPFFDIKLQSLQSAGSRLSLTHFPASVGSAESLATPKPPGSSASPGVKKFIGSVRRALSSRHGPSHSQNILSSFDHFSLSPSARHSNPTTLNTVDDNGAGNKRRYTRNRQERIDVLAAMVEESFKKAVEEEIHSEKQAMSEQQASVGAEEEQRLQVPHVDDKPSSSVVATPGEEGFSGGMLADDGPNLNGSASAPSLPMMSGALQTSDTDPSRRTTPAPDAADSVFQTASTVASCAREEPSTRAGAAADTPDRQSTIDNLDAQPTQKRRSMRQLKSASRLNRRSIALQRQDSNRSIGTTSSSLRRFQSYHSGLTRTQTKPSIGSIATSEALTAASDADPFYFDRPPPPRQLRRRPGGDLRAADNVHELALRRHSSGSMSIRTQSAIESMVYGAERPSSSLILDDDHHHHHRMPAGDPDPPPRPTTNTVSLLTTHSSQPNLRPSFEAEVAKLAALPDFEEEDGGIEAALMKLEGRYVPKSAEPSPVASTYEQAALSQRRVQAQEAHASFVSDGFDDLLPSRESQGHSLDGTHPRSERTATTPKENRTSLYPPSFTDSDDSYNSIPLLERGVSDITIDRSRFPRLPQKETSPRLQPAGASDSLRKLAARKTLSPDPSLELVTETESMRRMPRGATVPPPRASFLLNDNESLSDLSSMMSAEVIDGCEVASQGVRSFFDDEPTTSDGDGHKQDDDAASAFCHPLRHPPDPDPEFQHPLRHPPTPPVTAETAVKPVPSTIDTNTNTNPSRGGGLPTPGVTPTSKAAFKLFNNTHSSPTASPAVVDPAQQPAAIELTELKKEADESSTPPSIPPSIRGAPPPHLPFILAYDSDTLAQQFTLIEKDALDEIDWRDLIELRWKHTAPSIRDWVAFLRTPAAPTARGVDLVIARFNMVVKWAVSEVVLTATPAERARTLSKLIHVAAHARRLRNYATTYQLAVALLSADCARLTASWARVPAADRALLADLERLVQPVRNFHRLRAEMETAAAAAALDRGCIPFVGVYTRDLIYNAQKPAFLDENDEEEEEEEAAAAAGGGERLVNFERHHTAAGIVKSLLRLLEASGRYDFVPRPEVLGRCLWLAALGDEEIARRSRALE